MKKCVIFVFLATKKTYVCQKFTIKLSLYVLIFTGVYVILKKKEKKGEHNASNKTEPDR